MNGNRAWGDHPDALRFNEPKKRNQGTDSRFDSRYDGSYHPTR